jgi:signal transduction histidine kinase
MTHSFRSRIWSLAFGGAAAAFMLWSLWLIHSVGRLQTELTASVSHISRIQEIEPSLRQLQQGLAEIAGQGDAKAGATTWTRAARGYAAGVALLRRDQEIASLLAKTDQCARRILSLGLQNLRSPGTPEVRRARLSEANENLNSGIAAVQESVRELLQRAASISSDLGQERLELDNVAIIACLLAALASILMELNRRDNRRLVAAEKRLTLAHRTLESRAVELTDTNSRLHSEILQRERSEKELAQRTAELERSNSELERFAYVASHDLQEPLRAVAAHVQILQEDYQGRLDADADESIRHAVEGADHMRLLISDLLAYSRIGRSHDALEPTSAAHAFSTALRQLVVAIEESGAQVTCDDLPEVIADPTQLMQLFQNLVGNALKFRKENPPRVHVSVARSDEGWLFSVRDNGIGFDPKHAERIFAPFERLHGRHQYPGTGIGLAICKKIVERHGGRIWVESQPGNGCTFRFTLPGAKSPPAEATREEPGTSDGAAPEDPALRIPPALPSVPTQDRAEPSHPVTLANR